MEQPTTVWLIRHGEPDGMESRCYGRCDIGLSEKGFRQARLLAGRLAREPLAHIYSSPLRRAIQTAEAIAEHHQLPIEPVDAFVEIHFGDFEGLNYDEIQKRYPDLYQSWMEHPTETRFPNGETFQEMRQRVLLEWAVLLPRHPKRSIAIVAHGGVIRTIVAQALSLPDSRIFAIGQRYAAINRIDYFERGPLVDLFNGTVETDGPSI